jgi:hypothetical protein
MRGVRPEVDLERAELQPAAGREGRCAISQKPTLSWSG